MLENPSKSTKSSFNSFHETDELLTDDEIDEQVTIGDSSVKFPTKLPTFSRKVESCLQHGDFWNNDSERSQFISELAIFFSTNNIVLRKSCHYKAVVFTLFSNYVKFKDDIVQLCDIENVERSKKNKRMIQPWRLISRYLSRKTRTMRLDSSSIDKTIEKYESMYKRASFLKTEKWIQ